MTEHYGAAVWAAARHAWGGLLCYWLRVALAARERSHPDASA